MSSRILPMSLSSRTIGSVTLKRTTRMELKFYAPTYLAERKAMRMIHNALRPYGLLCVAHVSRVSTIVNVIIYLTSPLLMPHLSKQERFQFYARAIRREFEMNSRPSTLSGFMILAVPISHHGLMSICVYLLISFVELAPPSKEQKLLMEKSALVLEAENFLAEQKKKARALGMCHCPICALPKVPQEEYAKSLRVSAYVKRKLNAVNGVMPLALAPCSDCIKNFKKAAGIEFYNKPYFNLKRNIFCFIHDDFDMSLLNKK